MSYALITGGLGFIGSQIARQLIAGNHVDKVVCLDHFGRYSSSLRPGFIDFRRARMEGLHDHLIIERGEARFQGLLFGLIDDYRPDYIFHLAALPLAKLDNMNTQEAREGSVDSTANLLETLGQFGGGYCPKRFVYTSSSMVYGDFQSDVADELHPTEPKEMYGTMKLAGEVTSLGLGRHFGIPVTVIRPSAVYGPTDMNRRVGQIFLEKAMAGETLSVQGADEALDFSYVKDVARGFILAATEDAGVGQIFNITHGKAHTLMDLVHCLEKHFPDLDYVVTDRDDFRPKRGTLSIEKARSLLGFEPEYSLQRGIDEKAYPFASGSSRY